MEIKNKRNFKNNFSSSNSSTIKDLLASWKCIRPCAVRLERIHDVGKHTSLAHSQQCNNNINGVYKRKKNLTRPCFVMLKRIQLNVSSFQQVHQGRQKLQMECKVMLERLRYIEITITVPSQGNRNLLYTLEAKTAHNGLKYEDWRSQTIKALSARHSKTSFLDTKSYLYLKIPLELSSVFNVNGIKDKFSAIISVLSGSRMSSLVLDAYLTSRLETYKADLLGKQEKQMRLSPATPFLPNTNLQYLSILYYPIFETGDMLIEFPSEPFQKYAPKFSIDENTILISPQLACKHFYLSIFDFPARVIHVYDSCWKFIPIDVRLTQLQGILKHVLMENLHLNQHWTQWYINFLETCAQQSDEVSCGCFVIYFMENFLNDKTLTKTSLGTLGRTQLTGMRRDIVRELLPTTRIGRQILEAITE